MMRVGVHEYARQIQEGSLDLKEEMHRVIQEARRINEEYAYFNIIDETLVKDQVDDLIKRKRKDLPLAGVPVSVKDCICVKGMESTAGSAILKGYRPLLDATAIRKAKDAGAIIIGKTAQDEFGFGSFNVNVGRGFKTPKNPHDLSRVTGGSSGGSAGITAKAPFAHLSIAESTGGSIAAPAAFCGVVGITPTYGRVSRWGLIDYANSLDKIGSMGASIADASLLLEVIFGHDEKDATSTHQAIPSLRAELHQDIKGRRIALLKDSFRTAVDSDIQKAATNVKAVLEKCGARVDEIEMDITSRYALPVYYLLAMSEASTNLAKFCGMRYGRAEPLEGSFDDYFSNVRELHFGSEVKRRILLGTFARMAGHRDAFYIKAAEVRSLIIQEYKKIFKSYDAILSPTMPIIAPRFADIEKLTPLQSYMMDILTVGPNVAGMPHVSMPCGQSKGMPIGMMLTSDHFNEAMMVRIASHLEVSR
ncbi:Asp-tRNA(Asn)/Glu-tRNA(Gln) amidotransferase subunit GatA [Candidatus Woesearchaeota archaeon]|nr:Asp-tRNA(Asn)/Glu-tRNA(Gln) amidotransferase subunit GatA [Candidatus Woesearchaeota archaeon]